MADPAWPNIPNDPLSQSAYKLIAKNTNPTLQEIVGLLSRGGSLPRFVQNNGNSFSPLSNTVSISPNALTENSFAHEYSHALDTQMWKKGIQIKEAKTQSPMDTQFLNAMQKLTGKQSALIPTTKPGTWEAYRYSPAEASAWAVGNKANNDGLEVPSQPPLHLDATLATEQAILREMYNRFLNQNNGTNR